MSLPALDVLLMDVGLALDFEPGASDGLVNGLGMAARFKPPLGVGLALEMGDAATGGGFIGYEPDTGRYYGNVSLAFAAYGLGAIFVIDTRLPGDPQWALFASISGTWPGLPLGFGFLLTGVGGILALNRTMDVEALAAGLKSGAADAIMFPEDPLGDAALIVSELDAWFPIAEESFVFGLAAQISWGAKALVTAELGIVLSFPDLDIVVLGTITSVLPNEDEAELELHLDTLGVLDLSEGTVWITCALYDSALVQTLHLSGEAALYARFTNDPFFLLAVGGYHPAFQPPGGLPGAIYDLDRMRAAIEISDDVFFSLEAYFAITSNTLQFGSLASLEASSKFLGVTYTVRGEVGFDVLLVFSPFSFAVDFEASVAVTAGSGDHELLAVSLSAHLEGPKPWACSGRAEFTFLDIDVRFEIDVGGNTPAEAPPTQNVLALVAAALAEPPAWRPVPPAAATVLVAADDVTDEEVWASPDADLEAVQDLAPLDRKLDHYGAYAIAGPSELTVIGAGVDGAGEALVWTAAQDYFAPAQYDDLSRSEKLAAPSYEAMTAGVRFGIDGIALPDAAEVRTVTTAYERAVVDGSVRTGLDADLLAVPLATATFGHVIGGGRAVTGRRARSRSPRRPGAPRTPSPATPRARRAATATPCWLSAPHHVAAPASRPPTPCGRASGRSTSLTSIPGRPAPRGGRSGDRRAHFPAMAAAGSGAGALGARPVERSNRARARGHCLGRRAHQPLPALRAPARTRSCDGPRARSGAALGAEPRQCRGGDHAIPVRRAGGARPAVALHAGGARRAGTAAVARPRRRPRAGGRQPRHAVRQPAAAADRGAGRGGRRAAGSRRGLGLGARTVAGRARRRRGGGGRGDGRGGSAAAVPAAAAPRQRLDRLCRAGLRRRGPGRPRRACACRYRLAAGVGPRCRTRPRATAGLPLLALQYRARGRLRDPVPSTIARRQRRGARPAADRRERSRADRSVPQAGAARLRGRATNARCRTTRMGREAQSYVPAGRGGPAFTLDPARRRAAAGSRCAL